MRLSPLRFDNISFEIVTDLDTFFIGTIDIRATRIEHDQKTQILYIRTYVCVFMYVWMDGWMYLLHLYLI